MQASTATRPLSAVAGRFTVQLTKPGPNTWRVEVLTSGPVARPVEDLTRSYEYPGLARAVYTTLKRALGTPGATVTTARRAVVALIDAQIDWLFMQPGVAGRAEKVAVLQSHRAGFAADDLVGVAS